MHAICARLAAGLLVVAFNLGKCCTMNSVCAVLERMQTTVASVVDSCYIRTAVAT